MKKFVKGLIGVGVVVVLLGACGAIFSDTDDTDTTKTEEVATDNTTKAEAPAAEKETKQEVAPQPEKKEEPKVEPLAPVDLGPGKFTVGEDIKEGRYVVSTQEEGGNFFVYNTLGFADVNEILGTNPDYNAINNITVKLEEGQEIEINGLNSVHFEPKN